MGRLQDKVALGTGSRSGIGQGTAVEFAREGADVIVNYLHDSEGAQHTRAAIEALGRRAVVVQADVRVESEVVRMFQAAADSLGDVQILMNSAGVDASGVKVA